jgi:hypothetical protein
VGQLPGGGASHAMSCRRIGLADRLQEPCRIGAPAQAGSRGVSCQILQGVGMKELSMCGVDFGHGCARGRGYASAHVELRRSPSRERKTSFPRETHDRNSTADPVPSGNKRGNAGPVGETLQVATDDEPASSMQNRERRWNSLYSIQTDDVGSCVEREVRDVRTCRSPRDPRPPSGRSGFEFPLHVPGSGRT